MPIFRYLSSFATQGHPEAFELYFTMNHSDRNETESRNNEYALTTCAFKSLVQFVFNHSKAIETLTATLIRPREKEMVQCLEGFLLSFKKICV